jgi:hypothetical protein
MWREIISSEKMVSLISYEFNLKPSYPCNNIKVKVKQSHRGLDRPFGLQEVEAPRFLDNRHMKVVRLSALRTGRLYLPGKNPGTHFC